MIKCLLLISLLIHATIAQKPVVPAPTKKWLTLNGEVPLVIARGGISGVFPESSQISNTFALKTLLPDSALFCNLQLTKDGSGICISGPTLDNATDITMTFPQGSKTYQVNGKPVSGWFSIDYESRVIFDNTSLVQTIMSRPVIFDGQSAVSSVEDIVGVRPPKFWLNVQYDQFYTQHKLSVATFVTTALRGRITYLSSPEIGFLKDIGKKMNRARTKLVFVIQQPDSIEPTTNKKYGDILKDLASIKAFAAGILVPKEYIYPVDANRYLQPPTTLVNDAHKLGLEVFAYSFANDMPGSYNYSYDPTAEYLQFIDNSQFAVDGFLTDFSSTASEAIACLTNNNNISKPPVKGRALIITHNGASGVYPPCTDLAYQQAVDDGADIIDCSIQMSKDGVAFCSDVADLMGSTTVMTMFTSHSTNVPEVQPKNGIFSFDLTWNEIQTLKPQMISPFGTSMDLQRNPASKNAGKFVTLAEFLEFAKTKAVSGILISIANAAFLASKKGLDIVDVVNVALTNATFDKQSTQQVLIESDDTSVLTKFASNPNYKRVLRIDQEISDAPKPTHEEIKKYANAVTLPRPSLITVADGFAKASTNVVAELHSANITVYVSVMRNEFVSIPFDFYSDPVVELATYIAGLDVDGVMTEYPATATRYLRSPCSDLRAHPNLPYYILPAEPGMLMGIVGEDGLPPATAPAPVLDVADVVDPPLPGVSKLANITAEGGATAAGPSSSGVANWTNVGFPLVTIMMLSCILFLRY